MRLNLPAFTVVKFLLNFYFSEFEASVTCFWKQTRSLHSLVSSRACVYENIFTNFLEFSRFFTIFLDSWKSIFYNFIFMNFRDYLDFRTTTFVNFNGFSRFPTGRTSKVLYYWSQNLTKTTTMQFQSIPEIFLNFWKIWKISVKKHSIDYNQLYDSVFLDRIYQSLYTHNTFTIPKNTQKSNYRRRRSVLFG